MLSQVRALSGVDSQSRRPVLGTTRRWLVVSLAAGICLGTHPAWSASADLDRSVAFNIPAQPLESALLAFSRQAHIQVVIAPNAARDVKAPALSGTLPASTALTELLDSSGLKYEAIGDTVTVVKAGAGPSAQSAADGRERIASAAPNTHAGIAGGSAETEGGYTATTDHQNDVTAEVVVSARYEFLSADTSGTTNLPLPIEKVPQSISLVSNDFVKAADLKTLGEIAEYTPGATNAGNQYGLASDIRIRGFTPGRAVDGIDVVPQAFYEPDYAIFDRLEVVKGPASVVYGIASPGGLVNFVTKSATATTKDYVYAQVGSWQSYRVEGQIAGALDADGHVRGIGIAVVDRGDSFIDHLYHHKVSVYGGLDFNLNDSVSAYIHGGYEKVVRPAFDGIPAEPDGSPAPLARSFFIGSPNISYTTSVLHQEGNITWHATPELDISLKNNYEKSNTTGNQDFSYGLDTAGDIGIESGHLDDWRITSYGVGLSAIYHLDALLKKSFVSVGALYQNSDNLQVTEYSFGGANIFDGEAAVSNAFDTLLAGPLAPPSGIDTKTHTLTLSAQSVLQLLDPLSLLVGASYSKPDVTVISINPDVSGVAGSKSTGGRVSYRTGLTYEFIPQTTAYVSFSQSFYPQGLTAVGNVPLPNLTGDQYEAGVKYRSLDGKLLLTGAVYQITEHNLGEYDTAIGGLTYWKAIGEVRNRGVELQGIGQITHEWQVNAGYAYLDPKITEDSNPTAIGQTQLFLPKTTGDVFTTYTVHGGMLDGLSFGGGLRYIGAQKTSYDGSTRDFPGYALVDATAGYAINKLMIQFSAHNIFNRRYLISNYQTLLDGNTVGAPANFALAARLEF